MAKPRYRGCSPLHSGKRWTRDAEKSSCHTKSLLGVARRRVYCKTVNAAGEWSPKWEFFFMFPVLFRGTNALVPPLTKLVYSIRLLLGRVVSEKKRRGKGWQSCFNHVFQDDLRLAKRLMPESMSEYKKVNPNPNPNPNLINFNPNPNPNLSYTHAHR